MPTKRRARITTTLNVLRVHRSATHSAKFVYVFVANRPIRYDKGSSRIVYIGTTRKGLRRVVDSVGDRHVWIFDNWGIRSFDVHLLSCRPRQRVRMWLKLERALLSAFKAQYGELPVANTDVERCSEADAFQYFNRLYVHEFIRQFSKSSRANARRVAQH